MSSNHKKDVDNYCKDILSGKILACQAIKKAVKRWKLDLEKCKEQSNPYEYRQDLVDEFLDFAEQLKIGDLQTDTKQLVLLPWQKWIYSNLVGFVLKHDNEIKRFMKSFILVSRKNGKTTGFLGPLLIWNFLQTDAAESYLISGDEKQAAKTFSEIVYTLKADPAISKEINVTGTAITLQRSRIAFFSSETSNLDSYKPSIALIDEYWNYANSKPISAMEYGMRHRKNGQVVIITSAGPNIDGPAYEEYERALKVLNGISINESYFTAIYQIDEDDDWFDCNKLIKANPSLGKFLREEVILKDLNDALEMPSGQPEYISKTLGRFTSGTSSWIPLHKWEKNKELTITEQDLTNLQCFGALDLSSINDFTAYTLYFKFNGKYYSKHHFYIPEATVAEKFKKENINILGWIEKGYLTVIPGETIDYDYIIKDITADVEKYKIVEISYDNWQAAALINKLEDLFPQIIYNKFDQSLKGMSPATKTFEKAVLDGLIVDNNPIMVWMMGNVEVKPDVNGNFKPLKIGGKSSTKRIDGVITSIMAFSRLFEGDVEIKEYTTEEILASF